MGAWPVEVGFSIPSIETIRECYNGLEFVRPQESGNQMTLSKPSTVLQLAATLGLTLSAVTFSRTYLGPYNLNIRCEFMSGMLARMWRVMSRCNFGSSTNESLHQTIVSFIDIYRDSWTIHSKVGLESPTAVQYMYLLRRILQSLALPPGETMPLEIDTAFSNLVVDISLCYQGCPTLLHDALCGISRLNLRAQLNITRDGGDLNVRLLNEDMVNNTDSISEDTA